MGISKSALSVSVMACFFLLTASALAASGKARSESQYRSLSAMSKTAGGTGMFRTINEIAGNLDWRVSEDFTAIGNLRVIKHESSDFTDLSDVLYLVRTTRGELFIVSIPKDANIEKGSGSFYGGLVNMLESKMTYRLKLKKGLVEGTEYTFARFSMAPEGLFFDKLFKISMVLMLFLVMTGMGMTLSVGDFTRIAKNPKGIITGTVCQFIVMPLVAFAIGHFMGYAQAYPFIFIGMILVTATPGGATSNLMTYFAKGDLALSISMTAFATVLSLFVTPLILVALCSNIPDIQMPVKMLILTIFVLVLLPLLVGMFIRSRWLDFAEKATPFFSALGIIAVLFIGAGGVFSNLEVFSDLAEKFGAAGFLVVFSLTLLGMVAGGVIPRLLSVDNYQTRAISMEIGIRNVALGMTIALLIQDEMGDFNSYMFAVSGIFALFMYIAGAIAILVYKKVLPVDAGNLEGLAQNG